MSQMLRFGIVTGNHRPFDRLLEEWRLLEALGFDSAWVVDHLMLLDESLPQYEAWTLLSALAMGTQRIRLGVMVSGNTYRNPALLLKEAVTVDHISHGRLELGIGAGWFAREHQAYSFEFPPPAKRVAMLEEALQVIDCLTKQERTTFHGRYYQLVDVPFAPKPYQQPRIPLVIGASRPNMIRLAARWADVWNIRGEPEELRTSVDLMRRAILAAGRELGDVRFSVYTLRHPFESEEHFYTTVQAYRAMGFTEFLFPMPTGAAVDVLHRCAESIIPQLRREA